MVLVRGIRSRVYGIVNLELCGWTYCPIGGNRKELKGRNIVIKNIIIGIASLAAGALLYPSVSSTASAVSPIRIAAEECTASVYGQCVEPDQSSEEIATVCDSPCGCTVVIDIASSTVTYLPTECPPEPAPSQEIPVDVPAESSPYPTSSPEPDVPACQ